MSAQDCYSNDVVEIRSPGQAIVERFRLIVQWIAEARRRRRTRAVIRGLDDRQLRDIGMDRADVDQGFESEFTRDLGHSYSRQTMIQLR